MPKNVLESFDMNELGKRLRGARRQQGLKQEDVAKLINVARTTLIAIENGTRRIRSEEFLKLAEVYEREISDLLRPLPTFEPFQVQFRGPNHRSNDETEAIEPYIDILEELSRNYWDLEQMLHAAANQRYPPQVLIQGSSIHLAAETTAINERNRLGLGDGPIHALRTLLEQDIGLRIFYYPFIRAPKFSEIYFYNDTLGGCIALNSIHPEVRRRWSLAHAFGHFMAHRYKPSILEDWNIPESERFAEDFTARFLMPSSSLTRQFSEITRNGNKASFADLFRLAHYYGVSLPALMIRLEETQLIPVGSAERAKQQGFKVGNVRKELNLTSIPTEDQKLPIRYQQLAVEAFEKELIGENRLANLLQTDVVHARRIAQVIGTYAQNLVDDLDFAETQNQ